MAVGKCVECEHDIMLKYSALYSNYVDLKQELKLTQEMLKDTINLLNYLGNKCKQLEYKVELYKEKIESENKND